MHFEQFLIFFQKMKNGDLICNKNWYFQFSNIPMMFVTLLIYHGDYLWWNTLGGGAKLLGTYQVGSFFVFREKWLEILRFSRKIKMRKKWEPYSWSHPANHLKCSTTSVRLIHCLVMILKWENVTNHNWPFSFR